MRGGTPTSSVAHAVNTVAAFLAHDQVGPGDDVSRILDAPAPAASTGNDQGPDVIVLCASSALYLATATFTSLRQYAGEFIATASSSNHQYPD